MQVAEYVTVDRLTYQFANFVSGSRSNNRFDIYNGKSISFADIFSNSVDIDHIIPQSLGGLSVKHNLVDYDVKTASDLLKQRCFDGADKLAAMLIHATCRYPQ